MDLNLCDENLKFVPSCSKVFHVRSVTQGDVIRADAKEIPRIFQLLYAGEGEARKPDSETMSQAHDLSLLRDDKPGTCVHKGHEFLQISFHMPTTCEVCPRHLWHMFRPPPALECRRKYFKIYVYLSPNKNIVFRIEKIINVTRISRNGVCRLFIYSESLRVRKWVRCANGTCF